MVRDAFPERIRREQWAVRFDVAQRAGITYHLTTTETPIFTRKLKTLFSDDEYRKLQHELVLRPEAGDIIPGSGGRRKIRWAGSGRGKRGGVRVIYSMKEELFEELLESVKQGGAILRGEMKSGRSFEFDSPDVQAIRKQYGLSQEKFAALLDISGST